MQKTTNQAHCDIPEFNLVKFSRQDNIDSEFE